MIADFEIQDGNDTILKGQIEPGTQLYEFNNNEQMYVNQTLGEPRGENNYTQGDDIVNISQVYPENNLNLSNRTIHELPENLLYSEGGIEFNQVFDIDYENNQNELVVEKNGANPDHLQFADEVILEGIVNAQEFSEDKRYADIDENGVYYEDSAIIELEDGETNLTEGAVVIREGDLNLTEFKETTRFVDTASGFESHTTSDPGSAIVDHVGGDENERLENEDKIVREGYANLNSVDENSLIAYGREEGFDLTKPIYYRNESTNTVLQENNVRIGSVEILSSDQLQRNDVYLNKQNTLMEEINDTEEAGKDLQTSEGQFLVIKYDDAGSASEQWLPEDDTAQDILIYDTEGTGEPNPGDVVLFNQDEGETTNWATDTGEQISISDSFEEPDVAYNPADTELGFEDNAGDGNYDNANDNFVVNVEGTAGDTNDVVIAPREEMGLISSYNFVQQGEIAYWDVEAYSEIGSFETRDNAYFIDVDGSSSVSDNLDIRMSHWRVVENHGLVESTDMDLNIDLQEFVDNDDVKFADHYEDGEYNPGDDNIGGPGTTEGREAIIESSGLILREDDFIVREGLAGFRQFNSNQRFSNVTESERYDGTQAVVELDDVDETKFQAQDNVIVPGFSALAEFTENERYITDESGSEFGPGDNRAIIYDSDANSTIEQGFLDQGDDVLLSPGIANLEEFESLPVNEQESGLAYFNASGTDGFDTTDIIANVSIETKASGNSLQARNIFNFANTTKHTKISGYTDDSPIVNDTDDNNVYQDVFEGITLDNIASGTPLVTEEILENGLEIYEQEGEMEFDDGENHEFIAEANWDTDQELWNTESFETNITDSHRYFIAMNVEGDLEEEAYDLRSEIDIDLRGTDDPLLENNGVITIDALPPEFDSAITGSRTTGDSFDRDQIHLRFIEEDAGLASNHVSSEDFNVSMEDYIIEEASVEGGDVVMLTLNNTLETDDQPIVWFNGSIQDGVGNVLNEESFVVAENGLRPELRNAEYRDTNVDGTVDTVRLSFSERINYSEFSTTDWDIETNDFEELSVDSGTDENSTTINLGVIAQEGVTGVNKSEEPVIEFINNGNLYDQSENELAPLEMNLTDMAAPAITQVITNDTNQDSSINQLMLSFSENISTNESQINTSSFELSTGQIDSVQQEQNNSSELMFNVSEVGSTGVTPNVTMFNNTLFDFEDNAAISNQEFTSTSDGTNPLLLTSYINSNESTGATSMITLEFSQPVEPDQEEITLENETFTLETTELSEIHTLNYTEKIQTGNYPNISYIEGLDDEFGNNASLVNEENVTVRTFSKQMVEGWNFVSFPIADDSTPNIDHVLNTSKINVVWSYTNGEWETYDPEAPENNFESFEGGKGYLINATTDFRLEPNVNNLVDEQDDSPAQTSLGSGWNLIGHFHDYDLEPRTEDAAFASMSDNVVGAVLQQGETSTTELDFQNPIRTDDNVVNEQLITSSAYWAKVGEEGAKYSRAILSDED